MHTNVLQLNCLFGLGTSRRLMDARQSCALSALCKELLTELFFAEVASKKVLVHSRVARWFYFQTKNPYLATF
jgi:hypothetical protein